MFLIINWINPETDEQIIGQTDTNIRTISIVALAYYYSYTSVGPLLEPQPKLNFVRSEYERSHLVAHISLNFLSRFYSVCTLAYLIISEMQYGLVQKVLRPKILLVKVVWP